MTLIPKVSHNLGANTLPLVIASRRGERTNAAGMRRIRSFVRRAGVPTDEFRLGAARGLFGDWATPRVQTIFLGSMEHRPFAAQYRQAMPILNRRGALDGTVPQGDPGSGRVFAKTGTLVGARETAGSSYG